MGKTGKLLFVTLLMVFSGCRLDVGEAIKDIIWPADFKVMGMRIHCDPDCPPADEIEAALLHMEKLWTPHLDFDPRDVWTRYAIRFGTQVAYRGDTQILGMTSHGNTVHWIYYPYDCPGYTKGLCPGIFDWELGLGLTHVQTDYKFDEAQKIEWRTERGLYNELAKEID